MGRLKRDDDTRMHPLINTKQTHRNLSYCCFAPRLLLRSTTAASLPDCCFAPRWRWSSNSSMNHKWRKPSAALGATKWSISLKSSQKTKNKKRTLQSAVECRRRCCVWFPLVCGAAELRHFLPLKWSKQARLRVKHSYDCLERFIMRWAANKNSGKRYAPFRMSG